MHLSKLFIPILKDLPSDEKIKPFPKRILRDKPGT